MRAAGTPRRGEVYESVLASWGRGELERRFPGGEDCHELCARLAAALRRVAEISAGRTVVVVAHGGNLRAVLPRLAEVPDPGVDLGTGQLAEFDLTATTDDTHIRLLSWGT